MKTYKIGARGSLLSVTQSTLIKNQLELLSGDQFEIVTIKTQGDEITNKPLWQLEGKDFFTKELDEALLRHEVDLVIHSYKDLGSVRPAGIKLAAVTERKFAHDILLIKKEHINSLKGWPGDFIVGTSSPRRIANLTHSLADYLPYGKNLRIKCETLRGNVNTRIKKLKDSQYHAITLALAGLERLAMTEKSAAELKELLQGLNYFVLPQSVFPSAASQGALGIEINEDRDDGGKLLSLLTKLNHEKTIEEVLRERKAFKDFGGGCHLAVGIHVKRIGELFLHVHAGEVDGKRIEKKWLERKLPKVSGKLFVGLPQGSQEDIVHDEFLTKVTKLQEVNLKDKHVFVTSRYCLPTLKASTHSSGIWAAGVKTAKLLTQEGLWIKGTSDSLGTEDLKDLRNSRALQMMDPTIKQDWVVLSHPEAVSDLGTVVGCYERVEKEVSSEYEKKLQAVGACYWTSFPQYLSFTKRFPLLKVATHFCGLGKTWQEFQENGITVHPVASMEEFYELK